MEFFEYASIAMLFKGSLLLQLILGALCFVAVFIFEGIGLFVIAKRAGYKNKWMAFVPFFNTYYIGVCAQKNKFYKINSKTLGIVAAVIEAITFTGYLLYYISMFLIEAGNYYVIVDNSYVASGYPADLNWAGWIYNNLYNYVLTYLELLYTVVQVCLLICFFQTYACRRYVLFAITSILFPILGILIFVVRENDGRNFQDFVMAEQSRQYEQYRQYQQMQQDMYQNPYSRTYNPTGESPYEKEASNVAPEDPFGDIGGPNGSNEGQSGQNPPSGDSPFDELN